MRRFVFILILGGILAAAGSPRAEYPERPIVIIVHAKPGGAIDLTAYQTLKQNDPVEVTAGPFAGYQGLYHAKTGEQRAVILLEILNRQQKVQIAAQDIKRA